MPTSTQRSICARGHGLVSRSLPPSTLARVCMFTAAYRITLGATCRFPDNGDGWTRHTWTIRITMDLCQSSTTVHTLVSASSLSTLGAIGTSITIIGRGTGIATVSALDSAPMRGAACGFVAEPSDGPNPKAFGNDGCSNDGCSNDGCINDGCNNDGCNGSNLIEAGLGQASGFAHLIAKTGQRDLSGVFNNNSACEIKIVDSKELKRSPVPCNNIVRIDATLFSVKGYSHYLVDAQTWLKTGQSLIAQCKFRVISQ